MVVCGGCRVVDARRGDRWSPLASDVWQTAVTPDADHWSPMRGRERVRAKQREKGAFGGVGSQAPDFKPSFCSISLFFCSINIIELSSGLVLVNG